MTDEELRVKVAEAMGWKTCLVTHWNGNRYWKFYKGAEPPSPFADENIQPVRFAPEPCDVIIWEDGVGNVTTERFPNWPADMNAAMELVKDAKSFDLRYSPIGGRDWLAIVDGECKSSNTPARAICLAWLAAMEKK